MKTVNLFARYEDITGIVGLVCSGLPETKDEPMASNDGVMIAHYLIEHVNGIKKIGAIKDELQALGAMWFTRGQWGDVNQLYKPSYISHRSIGDDLSRLAVKFLEEYSDHKDLYTGIPKREKKDNIQEHLNQCIKQGLKNVFIELSYETKVSSNQKSVITEFFNVASRIMRKGYDKIERKFESRVHANSLFWSIANAIDKVLGKWTYGTAVSIGDTYRLRYDQTGKDYKSTSFLKV